MESSKLQATKCISTYGDLLTTAFHKHNIELRLELAKAAGHSSADTSLYTLAFRAMRKEPTKALLDLIATTMPKDVLDTLLLEQTNALLFYPRDAYFNNVDHIVKLHYLQQPHEESVGYDESFLRFMPERRTQVLSRNVFDASAYAAQKHAFVYDICFNSTELNRSSAFTLTFYFYLRSAKLASNQIVDVEPRTKFHVSFYLSLENICRFPASCTTCITFVCAIYDIVMECAKTFFASKIREIHHFQPPPPADFWQEEEEGQPRSVEDVVNLFGLVDLISFCMIEVHQTQKHAYKLNFAVSTKGLIVYLNFFDPICDQ